MVLGTNYPYGPEEGCVLVKNSLKAIDGLDLNTIDKEKILGGNAARVLGIRSHMKFRQSGTAGDHGAERHGFLRPSTRGA